MSKKTTDVSEILKLLGKSETQLNQLIHTWLNDEKRINLTQMKLQHHTRLISSIHEYVEILALQLNLPTKKDVSNVAKMTIQIEEKLEAIEEKLEVLLKQLPTQNIEKEETEQRNKEEEINDVIALRKKLLQIIINPILNSPASELIDQWANVQVGKRENKHD